MRSVRSAWVLVAVVTSGCPLAEDVDSESTSGTPASSTEGSGSGTSAADASTSMDPASTGADPVTTSADTGVTTAELPTPTCEPYTAQHCWWTPVDPEGIPYCEDMPEGSTDSALLSHATVCEDEVEGATHQGTLVIGEACPTEDRIGCCLFGDISFLLTGTCSYDSPFASEDYAQMQVDSCALLESAAWCEG